MSWKRFCLSNIAILVIFASILSFSCIDNELPKPPYETETIEQKEKAVQGKPFHINFENSLKKRAHLYYSISKEYDQSEYKDIDIEPCDSFFPYEIQIPDDAFYVSINYHVDLDRYSSNVIVYSPDGKPARHAMAKNSVTEVNTVSYQMDRKEASVDDELKYYPKNVMAYRFMWDSWDYKKNLRANLRKDIYEIKAMKAEPSEKDAALCLAYKALGDEELYKKYLYKYLEYEDTPWFSKLISTNRGEENIDFDKSGIILDYIKKNITDEKAYNLLIRYSHELKENADSSYKELVSELYKHQPESGHLLMSYMYYVEKDTLAAINFLDDYVQKYFSVTNFSDVERPELKRYALLDGIQYHMDKGDYEKSRMLFDYFDKLDDRNDILFLKYSRLRSELAIHDKDSSTVNSMVDKMLEKAYYYDTREVLSEFYSTEMADSIITDYFKNHLEKEKSLAFSFTDNDSNIVSQDDGNIKVLFFWNPYDSLKDEKFKTLERWSNKFEANYYAVASTKKDQSSIIDTNIKNGQMIYSSELLKTLKIYRLNKLIIIDEYGYVWYDDYVFNFNNKYQSVEILMDYLNSKYNKKES